MPRGRRAIAHEHYAKADAILRARPKGRIATPRLMGAVYGEILRADGGGRLGAAARARQPAANRELAMIVLQHGLFG